MYIVHQAHSRMKHMAEHNEDGYVHPQYSHHSHHGQQRELVSPPPEQVTVNHVYYMTKRMCSIPSNKHVHSNNSSENSS